LTGHLRKIHRFEAGPGWFRVTFPGPGERILDLIPEEGVIDLQALGLNERQIEALTLMVNEKRVLTNRDYRELFGVSNRIAANGLQDLVKKGLVKQLGSGRSVRYVEETEVHD
jgi:predicted HTH transcriptional regulator